MKCEGCSGEVEVDDGILLCHYCYCNKYLIKKEKVDNE